MNQLFLATSCVVNRNQSGCDLLRWIPDTFRKLQKVLRSGIRAFHDQPYPSFMPDLLQEAKTMSSHGDPFVLLTKRWARSWVESRHAHDDGPMAIVCKAWRELSSHEIDPFDAL